MQITSIYTLEVFPFQVIISVSKLIGEANSIGFQESLAMINNFANSDKTMTVS